MQYISRHGWTWNGEGGGVYNSGKYSFSCYYILLFNYIPTSFVRDDKHSYMYPTFKLTYIHTYTAHTTQASPPSPAFLDMGTQSIKAQQQQQQQQCITWTMGKDMNRVPPMRLCAKAPCRGPSGNRRSSSSRPWHLHSVQSSNKP